MAALHDRQTTGVGRLIEVNMLEANISFCIEPITQYFASGEPVPVHLRGAFSQAYTLTCSDGRRVAVHLSSPDKFWHAFCRAIGREEWIKRYPAHVDRMRHYDELAAKIGETFRTRTRDEWISELQREGVPFAPEYEVQEIESDPQVQHLGVFYEMDHSYYGSVKTNHRPVLVDKDRTLNFRPPPGLGEHTDEILRELNMSAETVRELEELCVIQRFSTSAHEK